ncbi:hypothetical protein NT6N_21070 [Oceaniferula spumae]|uniref:HTH gntR-type domain-containing protein n=1 Tax=Oceaniferula spumae TaxID=2979115 RepID=A0AAT9FMC5_9BACT
MPKPQKWQTRPQQIADHLRSDIHNRRWTDKLPGIRTLMNHYGVSRVTIDSALAILENQGLLAPAELRKTRRINSEALLNTSQSKTKKNLLILHDTNAILDHSDSLMLREMQDLWEKYHGSATWSRADFLRVKNPATKLRDLAKRHAAQALLLYNPPSQWSKAALDLLPSYFCGGDTPPGYQTSMSAFKLSDQIHHTLQILKNHGHTRILIPNHNHESYFTREIIAILQQQLPKPTHGTHADLSPSFTEPHPEVWKSYWQREFSRTRPTAVILFSTRHLLSLYSFCFEHQINIPRELSVILTSHDQHLEWLSPTPTMMRYPVNQAINHFHQWLDSHLQPIGSKFLNLDLIPGESLANAPAS